VRRIKILNGALWGLDALLTMALLAFTARYLVAPAKVDHLGGLELSAAARSPLAPPAPPPDDASMAELPNPLGPRVATPASPPPLTLKGALPAEQGGFAFINVGGREMIASKGETVHGWRLDDLWKDRATFVGPGGQRTEFVIPSVAAPPSHR